MRDIQAKLGISDFLQSPDIWQSLDGVISDFQISGQSLLKEKENSRTSDDIDMKLGPATKLDKENKTTLKKFDDDFMSANYDIIGFFFRFITNLEHSGSRIPDA